MQRHYGLVVLALCASASLIAPAIATAGSGTFMTVNDFFFNPKKPPPNYVSGIHSYVWSEGATAPTSEHNVRQQKGLFRSGPPESDFGSYSVVASAGRFPYYCEVHRDQGMTGAISVKPAYGNDPVGDEFTITWANANTTTGEVFDVRYRVGEQGHWTQWKVDTATFNDVFGAGNQPEKIVEGRLYTFEARSQKSQAQDARVSEWSPRLYVVEEST